MLIAESTLTMLKSEKWSQITAPEFAQFTQAIGAASAAPAIWRKDR
jgi:hypothetical protein